MHSEERIFRSRRDRAVAGVCAGIAYRRGYSLLLTRIVALVIAMLSGIGFIAYGVAWLLLPQAEVGSPQETLPLAHDPLKRSRRDAKLNGVCGGLAQYLKVDSGLLRVLLVLFVLWGGAGLVPYFYASLVVPRDS